MMKAMAKAKTNDEASAIVKREIQRVAGNRQIHHPISGAVHNALEKHPILRGKYKLRDERFESLAKDLASHQGYQDWHRKLDGEVEAWVRKHKEATEAEFETWLRWRYSQPDVQPKFPKGFSRLSGRQCEFLLVGMATHRRSGYLFFTGAGPQSGRCPPLSRLWRFRQYALVVAAVSC